MPNATTAKRTTSRKTVKTVKRSVKPFNKRVKQVVQNMLEKKVYNTYALNQKIITADNSVPFSFPNLLPVISQGTNQTSRIGNEIRVTKAFIRGYVNLLPYNSLDNPLSTPVWVKMWLCSTRNINTQTLSATPIATNFFETGATGTSFQGDMLDMMLTINKDQWILHKSKTFNLGATSASSTGPVGTSGYFDNSKMSLPFYFDYTKHCGKLLYSDGETNVPTNKNIFLVATAVYANGDTSSIYAAEAHFVTRVEYTDA